MSRLICFLLFLGGVITCISMGRSIAYAVIWGIAVFFVRGLLAKCPVRGMLAGAWEQARKLMPLMVIFVIIGTVTAMWRSSGTIAWFICNGTRLIRPRLFILVGFLLTSLISFALGTSFGSVGTVGIILMALARSGGVSSAITAGAVLSGAYFGDRCSAASSSASLVAAVTDTRLYDNLKMMLKTGLLPFLVTTAIYGALSCLHPLGSMDSALLEQLYGAYTLNGWALLPAALILLLPLCRVPIKLAMALSALSGAVLSVTVQKQAISSVLWAAAAGYTPQEQVLQTLLSGGGIVSMLSCCIVVMATGVFAGLLKATAVLDGIESYVDALTGRIGLYGTMVSVSVVMAMAFCNQAITIMMGQQLLEGAYKRKGADAGELAMDIENTGVVIAPLIPWNIAVSIPLSILGVTAAAIPYAVLLYMLPLCYGLTKKIFYPKEREK